MAIERAKVPDKGIYYNLINKNGSEGRIIRRNVFNGRPQTMSPRNKRDIARSMGGVNLVPIVGYQHRRLCLLDFRHYGWRCT